MSDPLIRSCEYFVVLEPGQPEKILSAQETLKWLESWLEELEEMPQDLVNFSSLNQVANRLLNIACSLEIRPGFSLQWFAVRLDK